MLVMALRLCSFIRNVTMCNSLIGLCMTPQNCYNWVCHGKMSFCLGGDNLDGRK